MWNTTGDRSGKPRYESLLRSLMHMDSYWYIFIDRDTQFISPVQNTHVHLWAFSCALRGFGALIGLIPQANFSASVIALHSMLLQWLANALPGCCNLQRSRKMVMEISERNFGDTKTSKPWETRKLTWYLPCYNMSQEKLLLGISHFATNKRQLMHLNICNLVSSHRGQALP